MLTRNASVFFNQDSGSACQTLYLLHCLSNMYCVYTVFDSDALSNLYFLTSFTTTCWRTNIGLMKCKCMYSKTFSPWKRIIFSTVQKSVIFLPKHNTGPLTYILCSCMLFNVGGRSFTCVRESKGLNTWEVLYFTVP